MKRNIILFFVILIGFVLQTTLFQTLNFGGISPNILIIITASYGFMYDKKCGMVVGFLCGLLMDIFYGNVLGFYALIYLYIGAANGAFHSIFYQDDIKLPLVLILASDFIYSFTCYVLLYLLRGRFDILFYLKTIILPEIVYTIFVTIFLYPCILLLNRTIDDTERGDHKVV
ncbi:MAG: rod shape-determining protein MreD [Lachnospiraceae bacterium]|nr:rod shape-determining protein MreD [Lachnospiraceae bacterium]